MIINDWDSVFTAKYGHKFPDSYLCIDTEFTGSSERDDLIIEIGHTMVEDGRVVDELSLILNWYAHPAIQSTWLDYKLDNMRNIVGPGWVLSPKVVSTEGIDPIRALKFYQKLFLAWKQRGLPFVAQNGQSADERMLRGNFNRYINKGFEFPPNGYFDTGAIFKASSIWEATEGDAMNFKAVVLPHRTDTLKNYFSRIINARVPGVKWSLPLILTHYGLDVKHNVTENQRHSAGFDSLCLHWIMEEYRSRIHRMNIEENQFDSAQAMQRAFDQDSAKYKLEKEKQQVSVPVQAIDSDSTEEPATFERVKRTTVGLSQEKRRKRKQRSL